MAIINFINTKAKSKSALKKIINYVTQQEKTDEKLIAGKDLLPECALSEMMMTKKQFGKTGGRQYLHMIQSFAPKENVDHEKAHEVALELAQHFEEFQVLVVTHKDKNHIHSHFIINSVNFENGLKIQQSFEQLQEVMDKSDEICKRNGLSVIEERKFGKHISRNEYHIAMKGESWKMKLVSNIKDAISCTSSKDDFIHYMNSLGYEVNWKDSRKHITYTTPDGNKCRCNKLHDEKYTKEAMENVFNVRQDDRQEQRANESFNTPNSLHVESRGLENDDECIEGSYHSSVSRTSGYDGRASREADADESRSSKEIGKPSRWKFGSDKNEHKAKYEPDREQVSSSKFGKRNDTEETIHVDSNIESDGDSSNSISDIGYNLSSLIAGGDDDFYIRSKTHTGDLTKEGEKEKALKDHNIWDLDR